MIHGDVLSALANEWGREVSPLTSPWANTSTAHGSPDIALIIRCCVLSALAKEWDMKGELCPLVLGFACTPQLRPHRAAMLGGYTKSGREATTLVDGGDPPSDPGSALAALSSKVASHLHTIDSQIEHADKASLGRLGSWLVRRTVHCEGKRREAERDLAECGIEEDVLREEWKKQVAAQTKPAQKRSKTRGSAVVEEVILARKRVNTLFQSMTVLRDALGDPNSTAHVLLYAESRVEDAEAAWRREQTKLQRLEQQLGVTDATLIQKLRHSDYYAARMNAKVLKERLRQRLREHKFELDLIERVVPSLEKWCVVFTCHHMMSLTIRVTENQKNDHAGAAIKRREPTISNTVKEYNKLCADIASLIRNNKAPAGAVAPSPIPAKDIFQLDVNDAIWQDMGLDEDTAPAIMARRRQSARWNPRNAAEGPIWFATEWEAVSETMKIAQGAGAVQYQLQLRREELLELCICHRGGPTQEEILDCQISGVTASYGNGQDSDEEGNSDDDERVGLEEEEEEEEEGGDELLYVLEAVERADNHRRGEDVEEAQWASDDDDVFN
ncbi:hypothetical protein B0H14DRAFT_3509935 [Mycena olivaceomarginata]|nr:hypothetical protein B0H14DRAFT_3509935 [Mycena olivaceomarginata]